MFLSWFTNKCEAYVDENGRALHGQAFEEAKRNRKARKCGNLVRLGAKVCRFCGAPAPGAGWTCGNCGAKISNKTQFCTECGAPQDSEGRQNLVGDVWRPSPNVFAQRFELNAFKNILERGLDIQDGQAAILLVGGETTDILPPGHYSIDDLGAFKEAGRTGKSRSIVMVRLIELEFPIRVCGLLTKEGMDAELICSVIVQFNHNRALEFMSNVMGNPAYVSGDVQSCRLSFESIASNILMGELEIAAKDFCNRNSANEIFLDPEKRVALSNEMSKVLTGQLDKSGFIFHRLAKVEFLGPVFEMLRRNEGELEVKRREMEFQLRAQALGNEQEKRASKEGMEHETYLKQLAQEMKISDALRDQELARLKEADDLERAKATLEFKFQTAKKELQDTAELKKLQLEHDEELKTMEQNGDILRRQTEHDEQLRERIEEQKAALEHSRIEAEIQKIKSDAVHARTLELLEEERLNKEIEREHEMSRVEYLKDADWKTLLATAKTNAEREQILDVIKLEQQQHLTPEQILAIGASKGISGASDALVAMVRDRENRSGEELDRVMQLTDKYMQAFERITVRGMESSAEAAKGSNATTQVIK